MYCSSCGVAVTSGLSYCNYCGAKLVTADGDSVGESREVKPELLVMVMTALFLFGLFAITILIGMLKSILELPVERVLGVALVPFLLLLILEGVFMRLLLRNRRNTNDASDTGQLRGSATKELDAAQPPMLPEHMSSVTEHTTRAFDPVYRERTPK